MSTKPPPPALPVLSDIPTTSPAHKYTTQERLLLSQAVYKLGALAWPAVSGLLLEHPCCVGRPGDLFSPQGCEDAYIGLMRSIGQNVPAQDAIKPRAKVHLRLAQTFYFLRMSELQNEIQSHEAKFVTLLSEINSLKSGQLDDTIRAELRGVLARKFGKRLLDSWVPEEVDVKLAVEQGVPGDDEMRKAEGDVTKGEGEVAEPRDVKKGDVSKGDQLVDSGVPPALIDPQPSATTVIPTKSASPVAPIPESQPKSPEAELRPRSKRKASPIKPKLQKPPAEDEAEPPITPAVEETSAVPAEKEQDVDEGVEEPLTTRSSKRKATNQPKGSPPAKKGGRKSAVETPTPVPESTTGEVAEEKEEENAYKDEGEVAQKGEVEDQIADVAVAEDQAEGSQAAEEIQPSRVAEESAPTDSDQLEGRPNLRDRRSSRRTGRATSPDDKVDKPSKGEKKVDESKKDGTESAAPHTPADPEIQAEREEEEEVHNTRGRRASRRTGRAISPVVSISGRTKGSSPAPSRRAPSASSTRSTPVPRRATTRGNRGVKDDEKSEKAEGRGARARDSKTVESVKEEVVEDDKPRRSTRRGKGDAEEEEVEPAEEPKSSRKAKDKGKEKASTKPEDVEEEQDEEKEKEAVTTRRGKRGSLRTPIPTPTAAPNPESNLHPNPKNEDSERDRELSVSVASVAAEGSNSNTTGRKPRYSSPRDARGVQKMILSLLDTICEHRNGNLFQGPVKKSEARDYYDIIKRPMDLKLIRTRIRDGKITSIDEFERDILLMFANAMMYNSEGSQVWIMAQEMMRESEHHIARFRHMRHEMAKS